MDEQLLRQAEQEIIQEAKRAEVRYSLVGPSGWKPCPLPKTNKVFLTNTLLQVLSTNRVIDRSQKLIPTPRQPKRKLLQRKSESGSNNFYFSVPVKSKEDTSQKKVTKSAQPGSGKDEKSEKKASSTKTRKLKRLKSFLKR